MIDVGCFIKKPVSSNDLIERVKKRVYTEIIHYFLTDIQPHTRG